LGGEETVIELADYIPGGKISAAEAEIETAEVRAEVAEARAEAEKIKAEARVKLVKSVFKMKTNNFDLPTIISIVGLNID
jgi:multidrug efflux pump subunit AcrA (membrane-fusion protein)